MAKSVAFSAPSWRSIGLHIPSPFRHRYFASSTTCFTRLPKQAYFSKERKATSTKSAKKRQGTKGCSRGERLSSHYLVEGENADMYKDIFCPNEYAGLNPCGGLRSDSIPKAGCPVVNLRQTLDDLTRNGFSVCIVEEVRGPTQARSRKSRFISGHAHPGSPYVFGLVEDDRDLEFPEPMPVVGVSRSAKGGTAWFQCWRL